MSKINCGDYIEYDNKEHWVLFIIPSHTKNGKRQEVEKMLHLIPNKIVPLRLCKTLNN